MAAADGTAQADVMKRQNWGLYAVALAIVFVGLSWVGVPVGTLLVASLVLACPLMMFFMMRHGHGHGSSGDDHHDKHHDASSWDRR